MRYSLDKKRLTYTVAYLSFATSLLQIAVWLREPAASSETVRYIQQIVYVAAVLLGAVALLSARKLMPRALRRAVVERLREVARRAASAVRAVSRRVLKALGIDTARYKKRKDERSFIFDIEDVGIIKKLRSIKGSVRYKDIAENSERIRFIYIKYMVKQIKKGYRHQPSRTPDETRAVLGLEKDDGRLVELYDGARYSGGSVVITDEDVQMAEGLVSSAR